MKNAPTNHQINQGAKRQRKYINHRVIRVLHALNSGPCTREELDRIAGASNSPGVVLQLRRQGFEIPCLREPVRDRDGKLVFRGVYNFTEFDHQYLNQLIKVGVA